MKKQDWSKGIVIPSLFASSDSAVMTITGAKESAVSFATGFSSQFSTHDGRKVELADINGIGRMASSSRWFDEQGGYYTFSKEVCDAIGGYPEGAILYYYDNSTGIMRTVRSMVSDNSYDFTEDESLIDGSKWKYVDGIQASDFACPMFLGRRIGGGCLYSGSPFIAEMDCVAVFSGGSVVQSGDVGAGLWISVSHCDIGQSGTAGMITYVPSDTEKKSLINAGIFGSNVPKTPVQTSIPKVNVVAMMMKGDTMSITTNAEDAITANATYTLYEMLY